MLRRLPGSTAAQRRGFSLQKARSNSTRRLVEWMAHGVRLDARRVGLRPLRAFTRLARRNFPGHLPVAYTNHDFSSSSEESGEADESSEESSEEAEESSESEQGESDAEWTTVKSRKRPQSDEPPGPSGRSEPKRSKRADELAALGEAEDRR